VNNFDDKCVNDDRDIIKFGDPDYTNKVTSIKVAPGYQAILYKEKNYKLSDDSSCTTDDLKCICADKDVRCIPNIAKLVGVTEIGNLDDDGLGFDDKTSSIRIIKESKLQVTCDGREIILAVGVNAATEGSAPSVCQARCTASNLGNAEVEGIPVVPYESFQALNEGLCEGNAWAEDLSVTKNSDPVKNTLNEIGWKCYCK